MVFSSTIFLFVFLPLVLLGNFALPKAARNGWLLATSLLFYAWGEPRLIVVMLVSIAWNYVFGLLVAGGRDAPRAKAFLTIAVVGNLALLAWYKYVVFLVESCNELFAACGLPYLPPPNVLLPIGISFYTFQAMSYVVDVYRGEVPPQRNPLTLGLYVAFFPQLVAGPIVRYADVAAEMAERRVTPDDFAEGVRRFVLGMAKKVLLANGLATAADAVFELPGEQLSAGIAWVGLIAYALQIYYDFSGYSDMAIGLGRMFGFRFCENFDHPYAAVDVTDFWRRWHISLSTWFRDYVYIPLGGNRRGPWITYRNLIAVFLLCGLWHGAGWNFLLWGGLHGTFLIAERALGPRLPFVVPGAVRHAYALLAVLLAWVPFRTETLGQAGTFYAALFGYAAAEAGGPRVGTLLDGPMLALLAAGMFFAVPWRGVLGSGTIAAKPIAATPAGAERPTDEALAPGGSFGFARLVYPTAVGLGLSLLLTLSAVRLFAETHNPFIYFRF